MSLKQSGDASGVDEDIFWVVPKRFQESFLDSERRDVEGQNFDGPPTSLIFDGKHSGEEEWGKVQSDGVAANAAAQVTETPLPPEGEEISLPEEAVKETQLPQQSEKVKEDPSPPEIVKVQEGPLPPEEVQLTKKVQLESWIDERRADAPLASDLPFKPENHEHDSALSRDPPLRRQKRTQFASRYSRKSTEENFRSSSAGSGAGDSRKSTRENLRSSRDSFRSSGYSRKSTHENLRSSRDSFRSSSLGMFSSSTHLFDLDNLSSGDDADVKTGGQGTLSEAMQNAGKKKRGRKRSKEKVRSAEKGRRARDGVASSVVQAQQTTLPEYLVW